MLNGPSLPIEKGDYLIVGALARASDIVVGSHVGRQGLGISIMQHWDICY